MARGVERRHSTRLTLPLSSPLSGPRLEGYRIRLLDLSPEGARIESIRPLPDWGICLVDLPRRLGGARLQAKVIWRQEVRREAVAGGEGGVVYQSGLQFTSLTPEQQAGLSVALEVLKTARGDESVRFSRLLAPGPGGQRRWVFLYVQPIGERWAAMLVADGAAPPEPGKLKGLAFFGNTAEEAERLALVYLREGVAQSSGPTVEDAR